MLCELPMDIPSHKIDHTSGLEGKLKYVVSGGCGLHNMHEWQIHGNPLAMNIVHFSAFSGNIGYC